MYCAIGGEPTNEIAATLGGSSRRATLTLSPWTTLNTPGGRPASANSCAQNIAADGSRSLGLSTNVFPHAIAIGYIHIGTIAGKLNGVMPATTPSGWRIEYESTSVETFSEYSPLARSAMPHANSMTSRPRLTSPSASPVTLPCSRVRIRAMSCWYLSTSWRYANRILVRRASDTERQVSKARVADATASSTTLGEASATWAWTSPVAGLYTSP